MPDGSDKTSIDFISMLERLVSFDTVSDKSNNDLIAFVQEYLAHNGVTVRLVPNEDGSKTNLYATIGPQVAGGIVLSGHTDVVPVADQAWTSDPFTLTRRDSRLFGRGTSDMKGFAAVVLALVPDMLKADLKRPIHIALSYDEEISCMGVLPMIAEMGKTLPPVEAVIVGEPTELNLVTAHKGAFGYKTIVTGHEAHSSLIDQGVSAISMASRLIVHIEDRMRERAARADPLSGFSPAYTTGHAGNVRGGTASNILARQCVFEWELRTVPQDDPVAILRDFEKFGDRLLEQAHQIASDCAIETIEECAIPALKEEPQGAAEALCRRLTGRNGTATAAYCTEAGQFQAAGMSTIVLGPGSIEQAHKPDEFIEFDQLVACRSFLEKLISAQAT